MYEAWHNAARAVAKDMEKEMYVSGNQHIDVYQALKHILGIYKGLFYTHELPRMKKMTLILGIWTANSDIFASSIKPSHSGMMKYMRSTLPCVCSTRIRPRRFIWMWRVCGRNLRSVPSSQSFPASHREYFTP